MAGKTGIVACLILVTVFVHVPGHADESCGIPPEAIVAALAGVTIVGMNLGATLLNASLVPFGRGSRTAGFIGRFTGLLFTITSATAVIVGEPEAMIFLAYGVFSYELGARSTRLSKKQATVALGNNLSIGPHISHSDADGYFVGISISLTR